MQFLIIIYLLGFWILVIVICLIFVICNLEFWSTHHATNPDAIDLRLWLGVDDSRLPAAVTLHPIISGQLQYVSIYYINRKWFL